MVNKVREGVSEHSVDNCRSSEDFLSENKSIHPYYLRTLQRRLGVDVLLRNGKLSTECLELPTVRNPPPLPYYYYY